MVGGGFFKLVLISNYKPLLVPLTPGTCAGLFCLGCAIHCTNWVSWVGKAQTKLGVKPYVFS